MRWWLAGAVVLALLAGVAPAQNVGDATLRPFDWPSDSTFEFGIFDKTGERVATAYYRILKEQLQDGDAYRLKYVGRNEQTSEASECWIDPQSMQPLRSTRKLVSGGRTFYLDVAYGDGVITIRRKYEGEDIQQQEQPYSGAIYDYESLIWLIPQIEFGGATQVRLTVFDTLNYVPTTVIVNDLGEQKQTIRGVTYPAHAYGFEVSLTPYQFWTVLQNGREVPAKFSPGSNSFENLGLDLKKVTSKAPPPKPEPEPDEEEAPQPEPGENPLGPPPSGSRF